MTSTTSPSQQELFRFLEDRFGCAQACIVCARACATRASLVEPGGPPAAESVRRRAVMCAEVCDATCRVLSEQDLQDETVLRVQVEWCRAVCLECARMFDRQRGGEKGSRACRDCARACTDFLAVLG